MTTASASTTAPTTRQRLANRCRRRNPPASPPRRASGRCTTTPTTLTQVFVRTPDGWVSVPVDAPADGHRRRSPTSPGATPAACVAEHGRRRHQRDRHRARPRRPADPREPGPVEQSQRPHRCARTRVAAAAHRPPTGTNSGDRKPATATTTARTATVIPFGIFDADAEAERWYDRADAGSTPHRLSSTRSPTSPLTTKEGWRRFVDHQPQPPVAATTPPRWRRCRRATGPTTTTARRGLSRRPAVGEHPDYPEGDLAPRGCWCSSTANRCRLVAG